jgi:hypothetical protein
MLRVSLLTSINLGFKTRLGLKAIVMLTNTVLVLKIHHQVLKNFFFLGLTSANAAKRLAELPELNH